MTKEVKKHEFPERFVDYKDPTNPMDTINLYEAKATHKHEAPGLAEMKSIIKNFKRSDTNYFHFFLGSDYIIDNQFNLSLKPRIKGKPDVKSNEAVIFESVDIRPELERMSDASDSYTLSTFSVIEKVKITNANKEHYLKKWNHHVEQHRILSLNQSFLFKLERDVNETQFTRCLYSLGFKQKDIDFILTNGIEKYKNQ